MVIEVPNTARTFITDIKPTHGFLNRVEMAFRACDPCLGCATHTLPGSMPLEVNIYDKDRNKTWTGNQNVENQNE
jgi:F420-non-reducing hydrogenase large subunit